MIEVVKLQAYKNINDWVLVDDPSAYSFSRPSRSLQDEPFSIPEQGLPQVDFQFKHEGIKTCIMHMNQVVLVGRKQ